MEIKSIKWNILKGKKPLSFLFFTFSFLYFSFIPFQNVNAAINQQINYQGKLTDSAGTAVSDGTYNMEFKLYTASSGGTTLWTETRDGANKVTVTSGLFSVMLGSVTVLTSVDFNQTVYLGVNIGGTGTPGWDGEMTPRKTLGSVSTAILANSALTVTTNANLTGPITSVGNATSIALQTGTGTTFVMNTSPTLVTPVLGVATATSINKITITAPATGATLTLAEGSSLITSGANAITFTSTGTTGLTLPTTGTLATLAGSETLSSKTLTTPILGVATATSINKITITAPATGATLTLAEGSSLITSGANAITFTSTGTTGVTLPTTGTLATLAGSETLSGKTLTTPKFADLGYIADSSDNELLIFDSNASAVNEVTLSNGATGVNPKFLASGETHVGLDFEAKGTGVFRLLGNATQAGELRFFEDTDNGSNYTAFKVGTQSGDISYTLPVNDGDASQVLSSDGSGVLSWITGGVLWTDGGTAVGTTTNTDNVGIGTATASAKLHITGGQDTTTFTAATAALGYSTTGQYSTFIHTRHNTAAATNNTIDFYTGDTTAAGVYPTDAVHGLTINNGSVGVNTITPTNLLSATPSEYSTGTASQSGTTITGSGTTFTSAMVVHNLSLRMV